jgi:hypothetical protein
MASWQLAALGIGPECRAMVRPGDFGFSILDFGLKFPNPKSAIQNPK